MIPPRNETWLVAIGVFLALIPLAGGFDQNGNGVSDVWEQEYNVADFTPGADPDGDGRNSASEAGAGTDPFDPKSLMEISAVTLQGTDIVARVNTRPGKWYRLFRNVAPGPVGWTPVGVAQKASGETLDFRVSIASGGAAFFRVEVNDADADGDGLTDWEEQQLPGFDPAGRQSAMAGQDDAVTLGQMLGGGVASVSVQASASTLYESPVTGSVVKVTRSGGIQAVTVPLVRGGNSDSQKGSAGAGDYELRTPAGSLVGANVTIPFGVPAVTLIVTPVADSVREVPERLTLSAGAGANYVLGTALAEMMINDAAPTADNDQLFLAYLTPADGSGSSASGFSVLRLSGDNRVASIDLNFSGLSSNQSATHIVAPGGSDLKGLPRGQLEGSQWTLTASQYYTTDQALLDALTSGELQMTVLSSNFPNGEIRGKFLRSTGSITPPTPGAPPSVSTLVGEALRRDVARFLTQSTFGPGAAEIEALATEIETTYGGNRTAGYSAWIDSQIALEPTSALEYVKATDAQYLAVKNSLDVRENFHMGWWTNSMGATDQLRQRMAFALSEIFVISDANTTVRGAVWGTGSYYDMLGRDAFGRFRDLLKDVTLSPSMGTYLSSLRNQKAVVDSTGKPLISPDENYAREVMQLFSIGLVQLARDGSLKLDARGSPIPTYSNTDITELARVFTGWTFSKAGSGTTFGTVVDNASFSYGGGAAAGNPGAWIYPMKNFAAYHDTGAKQVLGTLIPAGLTGDQDLDRVLDILTNHANTAPFIGRRLIQRLVTSNPSNGYIDRVAAAFENDGAGQRGNLRAVVKAILLDPEARNPDIALQISHGKQKEPLLRYMQILRAYGGKSRMPLSDLTAYGYPATQLDNFPAGATLFPYYNNHVTDGVGQNALLSPTVFNWFQPDYSPGGAVAAAGLVAPEMQITTETQVMKLINFIREITENDGGRTYNNGRLGGDQSLDDVKIDRTSLTASFQVLISSGQTPRSAVTAALDSVDLVLCGGRLKERYASAPAPNPRSLILDAVVANYAKQPNANDTVKTILFLVIASPTYVHQP